MQKTFDSMNQTGFSMDDMLNMNMGKMPNISMINLRSAGCRDLFRITRKSKEKAERKKEPVLDIKRSRHHIKSRHRWMST